MVAVEQVEQGEVEHIYCSSCPPYGSSYGHYVLVAADPVVVDCIYHVSD